MGRQDGTLITSNLYEAFDEKMKLLPKGQEAVNEFVKVRQGPTTYRLQRANARLEAPGTLLGVLERFVRVRISRGLRVLAGVVDRPCRSRLVASDAVYDHQIGKIPLFPDWPK